MTATSYERLVIVSNRLPVSLGRDGEEWRVRPSSGGLVAALAPLLRVQGGLWVGWPGTVVNGDLEQPLAEAARQVGYALRPVAMTEAERDGFYYGFANEVVWPLFHDLHGYCNFESRYWKAYLQVNRKFAQAVVACIRPRDYIWVHDYHLMNVAAECRALGMHAPMAFFLHIPFPPLDTFLKLPWRFQILHGMLQFDLLGFQTQRDRNNFVQCVQRIIRDVQVSRKGSTVTLSVGGRQVRVGHFPISIDYNALARQAAMPAVAEILPDLRTGSGDRHMVLGIDRLDYTKGIPEKLQAFRLALEKYPALRRRIFLVQVVVPSREDVPQYHNLKQEVSRLVGEINGELSEPGWIPVHYMYRSLTATELLGYYRTADSALVTPLKDGMNLVAKEYCACSGTEQGILILSEFAGAAAQLQKGALLVNPYDVEGVAETIWQAYSMKIEERRSRMRTLRRSVRGQDVFWWVNRFLQTGDGPLVEPAPSLDDYVAQFSFHDLPMSGLGEP